jgi:hypothetical protein
MNSLFDIMAAKSFEEPPEVTTIKAFVERHFRSSVGVGIQPHHITITTPSAALAGSLRLKLHQLQKECGTDKRLIIRIGS